MFDVEPNKAIIATSSGSTALHTIINAIHLEMGTTLDWTVCDFTWPSAIQGPLKHAHVVDYDTPAHAITTQGYIITNPFGYVSQHLLNSSDRIIVYDNAAAPLSRYNGRSVLNYGVASFVSLHHTKPIGFGEGGVVIIDKRYEEAARSVINFGFKNGIARRDGLNCKMSDITAAYILQYWDNLEVIKQKHFELYNYFEERLDKVLNVVAFPHYSVPHIDEPPFVNMLPVTFVKKYVVLNDVLDKGVTVRKYYRPLGLNERAWWLYNHTLCFSCNVDMTLKDVDRIIDVIKEIAKSDKCSLCRLSTVVRLYYEDNTLTILDCDSCRVPMVVIKKHIELPNSAEDINMERKLRDVMEKHYPGRPYDVDKATRAIPEHIHYHARFKDE